MKPFWRSQPLTINDEKLIDLVMQAHARCAERTINASSYAVANSAVNAGDYALSVIAALSTIGHRHAPIEQAYNFLQRALLNPVTEVHDVLNTCALVPGWGHSFYKDEPDPAFHEVNLHLHNYWPLVMDTIQRVTDELHIANLKIYPNPAAYTAAAALALMIPSELSPWLAIRGRLDTWAAIFVAPTGQVNK